MTVLIFLATLRCANLFAKIYDLMPFIFYELTKTQCFFYFIKLIFELKPNFFFTVTKKMVIQLTFLSEMITKFVQWNQLISNSDKLSHVTCPVSILLVFFFFFFVFCFLLVTRRSYFFPQIVFIVSLYSWYFYLYIAFIHSDKNNQEV